NLRIGTLNNGYSLEATDMNVSSLTLFRSHMSSDSAAKFPSCAATGASGAPQVSWQKVKLKKAEEVYLVCGTPKVSGCDASSKPSTPSPRTCNTCGTQSATVSCNESTGQWQTVWGSCSVSSSSQCATYSWQRDASMDCVFNPGSSGAWFCPMTSSADESSGPLNVGNSCTGVLTPAAAMWGRGPITTTSSKLSGSCSSSQAGTLSYWHAVYSGLSAGAQYTYGCVAYVCQQD
uniref:hypothetical protein n=1 Tax=Candidatus Avelusimicrobium alvi TaxID=3416221 RepID=UPI003D115F88